MSGQDDEGTVIRIPRRWNPEEALLMAAFCDAIADAIRQLHGKGMNRWLQRSRDSQAVLTDDRCGSLDRESASRSPSPGTLMRVPPRWTAEQASLFVDFVGHVSDAIWAEHEGAVVDLIVEHGGIQAGCRCRLCSPLGAQEDDSYALEDVIAG